MFYSSGRLLPHKLHMKPTLDEKGKDAVGASPEVQAIVVGDTVQVLPVHYPHSERAIRFSPPQPRKVVQFINGNVIFEPSGFDPDGPGAHIIHLARIEDLYSHPSLPEHFFMPLALLRELIEVHGWRLESKQGAVPAPAAVEEVLAEQGEGLRRNFIVVPEGDEADGHTERFTFADLGTPLVGSGRAEVVLSPIEDVIEEALSAHSKVEEALKSLESVLNLRPAELNIAAIRPSLQTLFTHKDLLKKPLRDRVVQVNVRLNTIYNLLQKPAVLEMIKELNSFLELVR